MTTFVFDIETVRSADLQDRLQISDKLQQAATLEFGDLKEFAADNDIKLGNRSREESVRPYIIDHFRKEVDRAALKLYGAEVCAIGYAPLGGGDIHAMATSEELTESQMICDFFAALRNVSPQHNLAGFNVRSFDLPVLRARCLVLGIPWPSGYPQTTQDDRYFTSIVDLRDFLPEGSLDIWLRTLGFDPKTGHGSQVQDMTPEERLQYVRDDVERERWVLQKACGTFSKLQELRMLEGEF